MLSSSKNLFYFSYILKKYYSQYIMEFYLKNLTVLGKKMFLGFESTQKIANNLTT